MASRKANEELRVSIDINPHYVCGLLGPLALATEMDSAGDVFNQIDYSNASQRQLVIDFLIRPPFNGLEDATAQQVKASLGYCVGLAHDFPSAVTEKLLLCGITESDARQFLAQLWSSLFSEELPANSNEITYKVKSKPLRANQFAYKRPEGKNWDEQINDFRRQMFDRLLESR